ncbi:MAG TPA: tetratricopeptide repeat protein [Thermodesulfovibrionales bacterium]|nr:tetratricopeptide repeat protein [Thermodesulfovibrionales bacterium]
MKREQHLVQTTAPFGEAIPSGISAIHYILLIVVCLLAYVNTFRAPFQYDDVDRMLKRPFVQDIRLFFDPAGRERFAHEHDFSRRSVGYFTFALNYATQNGKTAGYHAVNLAIHTLNAFLVYALVVLTFRTPNMRGSSLGGRARTVAFFSALLFAGHPIQTEAVTYIVQRLTSLATFFYLLSLVLYITWRLEGHEKPGRWFFYGSSLLSAVFAMKTKEISFTLPAIVTLYEMMFFRGKVGSRLLGLIPLLMTMLIIPMSMAGTTGKPLGELMGDAGGMFRAHSALSRWEYLATEMRVIITYIRLLFWPMGQSLDHDYPLYDSFFVPAVFLSFLILSAIVAIGAYSLYHSRVVPQDSRSSSSPGTRHSLRLVAFGIFWFFITLAVESSIIPIADVISEHRLYLPSIGFILACTSALFGGAEKLTSRRKGSVKVLITLLAITSLFLAGLTFARNIVWSSEVSLWEDVIQKSPMKARGYNGLGLAYYNMRQYDRAIAQFERAVALYPSYGAAFNNLGNALYQKGLYDRAIEAETRAIALGSDNPVFYFGRGMSLAKKGDYDSAIKDYTRAIAIDPGYADAYNNLGFVYHLRGAFSLAIEQYSQAIALDARNALFFENRGLAYAGNGELDKAIEDYSQAIAFDPSLVSAYSGRGIAYSLEGRHVQAMSDFDHAIFLEPGNAESYVSRGVAKMRAGHRGEALADFQHACDKGSEAGCRALQKVGQK